MTVGLLILRLGLVWPWPPTAPRSYSAGSAATGYEAAPGSSRASGSDPVWPTPRWPERPSSVVGSWWRPACSPRWGRLPWSGRWRRRWYSSTGQGLLRPERRLRVPGQPRPGGDRCRPGRSRSVLAGRLPRMDLGEPLVGIRSRSSGPRGLRRHRCPALGQRHLDPWPGGGVGGGVRPASARPPGCL